MNFERAKKVLKFIKGLAIVSAIIEFFYGKRIKEEETKEAMTKLIEEKPEVFSKLIEDACFNGDGECIL